MRLYETNGRERIYNAAVKSLRLAVLAAVLVLPAGAQTTPGAAPPSSRPASTKQMVLPSHGDMLLGVFYLAAGAGPHSTAFPASNRTSTSRSFFAPAAGTCWPCITAALGE